MMMVITAAPATQQAETDLTEQKKDDSRLLKRKENEDGLVIESCLGQGKEQGAASVTPQTRKN